MTDLCYAASMDNTLNNSFFDNARTWALAFSWKAERGMPSGSVQQTANSRKDLYMQEKLTIAAEFTMLPLVTIGIPWIALSNQDYPFFQCFIEQTSSDDKLKKNKIYTCHFFYDYVNNI